MTELVSAEISLSTEGLAECESLDLINRKLSDVEENLKRYTCTANRDDYAFAVFSGLLAGAMDSPIVGETKIEAADISLSHRQVNQFIQQFAGQKEGDGGRLVDAIKNLESSYEVPQDNIWKGKSISVSASNHHLADLAHHPTPIGLLAAMAVQFLRVGTFVDRNGKWHFVMVGTAAKDVAQILIPVAITGMLNWIVSLAEHAYEEEAAEQMPEAVRRLARLAASAPILAEVARCATRWFGHLVSDMGGSKNTPGGGMDVPGVLVSLLHEVSSLPGLKDSGLPGMVDQLYTKQRIDLRREIPLYKAAAKQTLPVLLNEAFVRTGFFLSRLAREASSHDDLADIDWSHIVPIGNRTVDRMLAISSMTFSIADTADAATRAAMESGANWILLAGRMTARINYVGAGRATIAIAKEIDNESKETKLLHEKMVLSETKAAIFIEQLRKFEKNLEQQVGDYIIDDLEAFANGMNDMDRGIAEKNADFVIKGSVAIQKALGRDTQFANKREFETLMGSDDALIL